MENGRVVELELEDIDLTGAVPAEVGGPGALRELSLGGNQLTSVPAEIGQLTSLVELYLHDNQLTSVPAEVGADSRRWRGCYSTTMADELAGGDRAAHGADGVVPPRQSADERAGGDRAGRVADSVALHGNQLTSLPAGVLTLTKIGTSVPAEIGQLAALKLSLTAIS